MSIDTEDLKDLERLYLASLGGLTEGNRGWTFFRMRGDMAEDFGPDFTANYREWMSGFLAAMGSRRAQQGFPSVQAALTHFGINGLQLETLLRVAEEFEKSGRFTSWPTVPIRGGPRGWRVIQGGINPDEQA